MTALQFGIQSFWFWNGEMAADEIVRQISEMHRQGLRGFLIHPRQGMQIPYFSSTYFDRVRTAVEAARERNMEVWLYDEFPYPSGAAGGEVFLGSEDYRCRSLARETMDAEGGELLDLRAPWGRLLTARAYRYRDAADGTVGGDGENGAAVDWSDWIDLQETVGIAYQQDVFQFSGLTAYNRKRFFQGDPCRHLQVMLPSGSRWHVEVFVETIMEHFKYFEYFVDPLNAAAVRRFLACTHDRYACELGDALGTTVRGIFTDETQPFPPGRPWSPILPAAIQSRHGVDIHDYLPVLFNVDMGSETSFVRYAYRDTAAELFMESYDRQIQKWCHEHGLLYIGEKPILRSAQLACVDIPGIDTGHIKLGAQVEITPAKYRANGKIAASAAYVYQKPGALCEAFHSIGWGMTLQDMRETLDWLAIAGINWYIPHASFYTTDGLTKHDAPPSFFYQMPWWSSAHLLSEHVAQLNSFLRLPRQVKLILLDPVTSHWAADLHEAQMLSAAFAALQEQLLAQGIDFYILDPRSFAELPMRDGHIVIREDLYGIVILPAMTHLETAAARQLLLMTGQGGRVACWATIPADDFSQQNTQLPQLADALGLDAERVTASWLSGQHHPTRITETGIYTAVFSDLCNWLQLQLKTDWTVESELLNAGCLRIAAAGAETGPVFFVKNLSAETGSARLRLADGRGINLMLGAHESRFIKSDDFEQETEAVSRAFRIDLTKELPQRVSKLNALRIAEWELETDDGQTARVDSFPFIDQYDAAGIRIAIEQESWFGCPKQLAWPGAVATYRCRFNSNWEVDGPTYLVMEPGTLLGDWSLSLNGHALEAESFRQMEVYLPTNYAAEVGSYLHCGTNELVLTIASDLSYGGIRNPLYLCGTFAVARHGRAWCLEEAHDRGWILDRPRSGLPFYAGSITYTLDLTLSGTELAAYDALDLEHPDLEDVTHLRLNGIDLGSLAWSPRQVQIPKEILRSIPADDGLRLEITLDTSLISLFEGQRFNRSTHRYEEV